MSLAKLAGNSRTRFQNVYIFLLLIIPLAILGFWKSYFGIINSLPEHISPLVHIHGWLMFLWLLMLIAQAGVMRARRFRVHRWIGRGSYILAPVAILSGLAALHHEFNRTFEFARVDVIALGMVLAFSTTWTLGIVYKNNMQLHARYMISTAFAIGSAIVFRVFINWVPGFESEPVSVIGNGVIHFLPLAMLIAMDWRKGIRLSAFWVVTVILGIAHLGYWTFANADGWLGFCAWYANLI
jgi:hypothetical protein